MISLDDFRPVIREYVKEYGGKANNTEVLTEGIMNMLDDIYHVLLKEG